MLLGATNKLINARIYNNLICEHTNKCAQIMQVTRINEYLVCLAVSTLVHLYTFTK